MVSIGTITKIAGLAIAGLVGYSLIKNAGNIGSQVGGFVGTGFAGLGKGITEGFSDAFDIFGGAVNPETGGATGELDPNITVTDPNKGVVTGDPKEEGFNPISSEFKSFVSSGILSKEFAEAYSFQPPARSGQLDVSKTFAYISSPTYRANQEQANLNGGNYGGFGTEQAQTNALAGAIASSAEKYPEWFA